jgi:putrescine transport system substrate-binding protein
MNVKSVLAAAGAALACIAAMAQEEEKVLNIYNWSDYIAEDTIRNFEKETGIKVRYDNFDNNEIVHAKLVAGKTGYDIVVPSSNWAKLQIDGGLLRKLDKPAAQPEEPRPRCRRSWRAWTRATSTW